MQKRDFVVAHDWVCDSPMRGFLEISMTTVSFWSETIFVFSIILLFQFSFTINKQLLFLNQLKIISHFTVSFKNGREIWQGVEFPQ